MVIKATITHLKLLSSRSMNRIIPLVQERMSRARMCRQCQYFVRLHNMYTVTQHRSHLSNRVQYRASLPLAWTNQPVEEARTIIQTCRAIPTISVVYITWSIHPNCNAYLPSLNLFLFHIHKEIDASVLRCTNRNGRNFPYTRIYCDFLVLRKLEKSGL